MQYSIKRHTKTLLANANEHKRRCFRAVAMIATIANTIMMAIGQVRDFGCDVSGFVLQAVHREQAIDKKIYRTHPTGLIFAPPSVKKFTYAQVRPSNRFCGADPLVARQLDWAARAFLF